MAQAEIPLLQKSFSLGNPNRLATAPVAITILLACTVLSLDLIVKGR